MTTATSISKHDNLALPSAGRALVSIGRLDEELAHQLQQEALAAKRSFVAQLAESQILSASELAATLSRIFSAPLIDVDALEPQDLPDDLLSPAMAEAHQILVLGKRGTRLLIATADPSAHELAAQIKFITQCKVEWVVAEYDKLKYAVASKGRAFDDAIDSLIDEEFGLEASQLLEDEDEAEEIDEADAPIVRLLHKVLLQAIQMGASDLHFEPYEHTYRIRFRIDGKLREIASPPALIKDKLASRIKIISHLDISEKRIPQDGRMKLRIGSGHYIDFRVSTLPTLFGEKIVIRILDSKSAQVGIEALGYEPEEKQRLLDAIQRPYGMILMTGPTGSGKTVSLYTCLNLLNQPGVNISTVEDPSEINLPGANQVNINDKAGLTFATALRAFLRQDPDIIMVGEVRDLETADIAVKAAQTGHLLLSTLHTNDAPSTLTRLRNMGIAPFNIASSVILISAQRLARRLCKRCKTPVEIPAANLIQAGFSQQELGNHWTPYGPVGCRFCNNGYKGRIGIYEVMPISEEMESLILADANALEIEKQARNEGVRSLRQSGLIKVMQGITSLEEILAVTNQ